MIDDLKAIDTADLPTVFPGQQTADLRPMARARSLRTKIDRHRFQTARNTKRAAAQIGRLPEPGEALHLLLQANAFALFDALPAVLEIVGRPADEVLLATLGINERHLAKLDELFTTGQIRHCSLLLSHYFSRCDQGQFRQAVALFGRHGFPIKEARSHAKVIALRFGRQKHVVIESSGNLRSCRAAEVATMYDSRELFDWHAEWIREMLTGGSK
jgi:hypothetical protein